MKLCFYFYPQRLNLWNFLIKNIVHQRVSRQKERIEKYIKRKKWDLYCDVEVEPTSLDLSFHFRSQFFVCLISKFHFSQSLSVSSLLPSFVTIIIFQERTEEPNLKTARGKSETLCFLYVIWQCPCFCLLDKNPLKT